MLAARGLEHHRQGADRFHFLSLQGGTQGQGLLLLIKEYDTKGIEPYDEVGPLLHCLTHTLGMGIASICHGDIAGTEREVLECFARMHIADEHFDKLQGHQVHRDMEAMVGACGSWSLNRAGVDDN